LKQQLNQTFKECDASKYEIDKFERQLATIEGDIMMFERRLIHQDAEHTHWKQFIAHLQRLILQGKNEIHGEIIAHASYDQACKQLRINTNKLREQYQQKLNDLQQTSAILGVNAGVDRTHLFKSELSSAIRKVRQDFERLNEAQSQELYTKFALNYENIVRNDPNLGYLLLNDDEQQYVRHDEERVRAEIQRFRMDSKLIKQKNTEIKAKLREYQIDLDASFDEEVRIEQLQKNEINQLNLRHEKIRQDYDDVISKQSSLEKEIDIYRHMLEGTMKSVAATINHEYDTSNSNVKQVETRDHTELSNRARRSSSVDRSLSTLPLVRKNTMSSSLSMTNDQDQYQSLTDSVNKFVSRCRMTPVYSLNNKNNDDVNRFHHDQ
jgi:hypothetical protein